MTTARLVTAKAPSEPEKVDWKLVARGLDSPDAKDRGGVLLAMEQVHEERAAEISWGYETSTFALGDGCDITGIVHNESSRSVEIQDADAKTVRLGKADFDEGKRRRLADAHNGLAQGLSRQDFGDLTAYLETLKHPR